MKGVIVKLFHYTLINRPLIQYAWDVNPSFLKFQFPVWHAMSLDTCCYANKVVCFKPDHCLKLNLKVILLCACSLRIYCMTTTVYWTSSITTSKNVQCNILHYCAVGWSSEFVIIDIYLNYMEWFLVSTGIIAVSCGEGLSFDDRVDNFSRILMTSSLLLIWSFSDPIHPLVSYPSAF